jgi:hypothetical protein
VARFNTSLWNRASGKAAIAITHSGNSGAAASHDQAMASSSAD